MSKLNSGELINELFNINHELIIKFKKYKELRSIKENEESTKYSKMDHLFQVNIDNIKLKLLN